jgi:predicted deacylase
MSKQFIPVLTITRKATAGITAHRFVSYAGALVAAAAAALGVSRTDALAGDDFSVDVQGTAVVEAGGAIAEGAQVEADASARAVTKNAGVVLGRALQPAAAAGDFIEVLLLPN